ncbi:hypothetical protein GYMLUDRAFT_266131, partial [Collybiopsis luxurians FD-317 M1]
MSYQHDPSCVSHLQSRPAAPRPMRPRLWLDTGDRSLSSLHKSMYNRSILLSPCAILDQTRIRSVSLP